MRKLFLPVLMFFLSFKMVLAKTDFIPDILKEMLTGLFVVLPQGARAGGTEVFVIWAKFLFFIMLTAIIYFGAKKLFQDNARIALIVSICLSLTGIILMPTGILIFLFHEFTAVLSIGLGLLPVFVGLYLRSRIPADNPIIRALVIILVAILAIVFAGYMIGYSSGSDDPSAPIFDQVGQWSMVFGTLGLVWGFFSFVTGFSFGGAGAGGTHGATGGRDWLGRTKGAGAAPGTIEALGLTKKEQTYAKAIVDQDMVDLDTDIKLVNYLKQMKDFVDKYLTKWYSIAGVNYDEFRRRKMLIKPKLDQVLHVVENREERDKKVNQIFEENKLLLDRMEKVNVDDLRIILKEIYKNNKDYDQAHKILIDNKKVKRVKTKKVEEFMKRINKVLEEKNKERIKALDDCKKELTNNVIGPLGKIEPIWAPVKVRQTFNDIEKAIGKCIAELEKIIGIDNYMLNLGKELYKEDTEIKTLLGF
ncbi:MAG: hypothetical protein ABIJ08_03395 [Nanoarchaeota archaeon]